MSELMKFKDQQIEALQKELASALKTIQEISEVSTKKAELITVNMAEYMNQPLKK